MFPPRCTLLASICLMALVAICKGRNLPEELNSSEVQENPLRLENNTGQKAKSPTESSCETFSHVANRVTYMGEELKIVGHGYSTEQCQQACLSTTEFTCTAALIHRPSECFVMGYDLRNDYQSTHYQRTCSSGPQCFRAKYRKTADFTIAQNIPRFYSQSASFAAMYCMSQCEAVVQSCVGFDLLQDTYSGKMQCMFMDTGLDLHLTSFDLYVRQCDVDAL